MGKKGSKFTMPASSAKATTGSRVTTGSSSATKIKPSGCSYK